MGESAVDALAMEQGISRAEAQEILDPAPRNPATHCPICDKHLANRQGVIAHAEAKHTRPRHIKALASWKAANPKKGAA